MRIVPESPPPPPELSPCTKHAKSQEWEGVATVTAFDIGQEFYVVVADSDWDVIDQTPECFSLNEGWTERP